MRNWKEYLNRDILCECGREHRCDIQDILIGRHVLDGIPRIVREGGYRNICIVADRNTYAAAGERVAALLKEAGVPHATVIFEDAELLPDERALGTALAGIPACCGLILAVGAGTINDLCKFLSHKLGTPYFIVATAPSMDGYASNVAPLMINSLKTTYEVGRPRMILGDTQVLAAAPADMIRAGIGDMLGKYVCLADWRLAHLITGEYYCDFVAGMMREAADVVCGAMQRAVTGDEEAVESVMEGLVLSGIAMSYTGNSRPASGSEHHLSHFWEMMLLQQKKPDALHGLKVGVGTCVTLSLYHKLRGLRGRMTGTEKAEWNGGKWEKDIRRVYGPAAAGVIALEQEAHKNDLRRVDIRRAAIREKADDILSIAEALPQAGDIGKQLAAIGAPSSPREIGVHREMLRESILYAKELRNRYGLLQFLFDIGELEKLADAAAGEIYG